jgi:GGDEF domain-containing protein
MIDALLIRRGPVREGHVTARFPSAELDALGSPETRKAAVFLLHETASGDALGALHTIRGHRLPSIYLKPVVLVSESSVASSYLAKSVDGVWNPSHDEDMPAGLQDACGRLRGRADALEASGPEGDSELSFRLLRFMASRDQKYEPEATVHSPTGFSYPALDSFVGAAHAGADVGLILEALEEQRVVEGRFLTKAHACTHCGCGFLNFLEVCPDCGHADLTVDDMVHHFRCGYVAPSRDFRRGSDMVCPKCSKSLKHVGVDYDKPSLVFDCVSCRARFPSPQVTTSCYQCRRVTPPEMQVMRRIKVWGVTPFGHNAAKHGLDSMLISVLQDKVPVYDYPVFRQLVAADAHRTERYERPPSALLVLKFENYEATIIRLGSRRQELFEAVAKAFQATLRPSDLVSIRNESLFLVLTPETDAAGAARVVERLKESIDRLFEMAIGELPGLSPSTVVVGPQLDLDAFIAEVAGDPAEAPGGRSR